MSEVLDRIRKGESGRSEKAAAWQVAMGLQAADGLRTSEILWQVSQKHVSGKTDLDQVKDQLRRYYSERNAHDAGDPEKEEADKVAANITGILLSETLEFSPEGLSRLHRMIFDGVYEGAGVLRDSDVSKREWVLGGDAVSFLSLEALPGSLEHALAKERSYPYASTSSDELISHLAAFVSEIWLICAFGEGNTRFTAVFTLLYLRYLGIDFKFDTFKNDSWYFHNALVRANYRSIEKNIEFEPVYLERFFRNLLLGEQWDLRNRYLHVRPAAEWSLQSNLGPNISTGQVQLKNSARKGIEKGKKRTSRVEVEIETKALDTENEPISAEKLASESKSDREGRASPAENALDNPNVLFLSVAIGDDFLSVKDMMARLHLRGRDNFLKLYLSPAVSQGFVTPLFPKSPRHPRQKYLLTQKGLDYLKAAGEEMTGRIRRHLAGSSV